MRSVNTRTFLLVLLALCAAARAASARQFDWREFKSEAGGFSIKFPGVPRVSQVPMVKGPITLTRHAHMLTAGGYEFEMAYVDMPAGNNEPELVLEGGISGITNTFQSQGGRVLSKNRVTRGTCEGLEATFELAPSSGAKGYAHARIFNSGQRYFLVVFVAQAGGAGARAAADTFVESLVIKDGCKAPLIPTAAPTAAPVRSTVEGVRDPATGWRKIEAPELGFSVLMPGPAQRTSGQSQVQPFPLSHHVFIYETGEIIYSAEVIGDYPVGFFSTAVSYENLLDVTVAAIKRNLGEPDFVYGPARKLSVGQYPGREYALTNEKAGARGRVQLYATPRRFYVFIALSRGPKSQGAEIERFFSSVLVSPK
jgi:hypothetical protein